MPVRPQEILLSPKSLANPQLPQGRTGSSAPTEFLKSSRFCVGDDAHIVPAGKSDFTLFLGEFGTSQWVDVGIGSYEINRKFSKNRAAKHNPVFCVSNFVTGERFFGKAR